MLLATMFRSVRGYSLVDVVVSGTKPECLAYIKEVWTDMRPLSLRKKMEESGQA